MVDPLTPIVIDPQFAPIIYKQDYSKKPHIDGVRFVSIKNITGEDGSFSEILRMNENGELEMFPGFTLAQINRTTQQGNTVKAWHLHLLQDELWYLPPPYTILVGLWDVRQGSPTCGMVNRIMLDGNNPQLLFIPRGVAHGSATIGHDYVNLYYFINRKFNLENPDEKRIPWDKQGADFWQPQRD